MVDSGGAAAGLGTTGTGGLTAAAAGRAGESAAFLALTLRLRGGATGTVSLWLLLLAAALTAGSVAGTLRAVFLAAGFPVAALGIAVLVAMGVLAARLRAGAGPALLAAGVGGWGSAESLLVIRNWGWRLRLLAQGRKGGSW